MDTQEHINESVSEHAKELLTECQKELELFIHFIRDNGGISRVIQQFEEMRLKSYLNKETLSLEEAADYLDVTKDYMYRLTAAKEFPLFKPGGKLIYIRRSDIEEWIVRNRIRSKEEINKEAEYHILMLNKERRMKVINRNRTKK